MEVLIVTGMSGAGKSKAMNALEDMGYFCVDNIPPYLIFQFASLCEQSNEISKLVIVSDSRGGEMTAEFENSLEDLKKNGTDYRLLFLECSKDKLTTRFKETRRKHPLLDSAAGTLSEAIDKEKLLLAPVKKRADITIDTTMLAPKELKNMLDTFFLENARKGLLINCMSFGFKYGIPQEADLVFDVRCLPNPFYIPELKNLTGLDEKVRSYVFGFDEANKLLQKLEDLLAYLLPLYRREGKSQLVVALGCTGGKHRSVAFAESLHEFISNSGGRVVSAHRDIGKS
ncbi:MAG: RNase adapter RapZ [Oscillospiraceae bacterium]|jgi:UPF0042 nucleotide-binding protein|nr:RNase adapter RapZ [Oscillospiraceae bacterium]